MNEEFLETEDLQGVAFGSEKDYMSRGHLPAIDLMQTAIGLYIDTNNTHIGYIDSYLDGEGNLSEDRI